jgi:hypothetical protein
MKYTFSVLNYTGSRNWHKIKIPNCKRCNEVEHVSSGDFDAICPLTATRYSIIDLELSVMEPWRPWIANKEVNDSITLPILQAEGHLVFLFNCDKLGWFIAGWRLSLTVHGRSCACFSEGSWPSSSLFPA